MGHLEKIPFSSAKMKLFGATLIATAAAQMNSSRATGNKYGQVSDDPHFVVMTTGQEPLCFDFNPANGTEMNLLLDPETNLAISATAHDAVKAGKTFMSSTHFPSRVTKSTETSSSLNTGTRKERENILVCRLTTDQRSTSRETTFKEMSVAIVDTTGISQKSRGLVG